MSIVIFDLGDYSRKVPISQLSPRDRRRDSSYSGTNQHLDGRAHLSVIISILSVLSATLNQSGREWSRIGNGKLAWRPKPVASDFA
jgi:hypothetical protein